MIPKIDSIKTQPKSELCLTPPENPARWAKFFKAVRNACRQMHASLLVLAVLAGMCAHAAEEVMRAGDDSWHPVGLFCCKVITDGESEVRLFRLSGGKPEVLFTKRMATPIRSPICLSNAVVVVGTDGVINKFNLEGDLIFSARPERFRGSAMSCVRLGDQHVFVTEVQEVGNKKDSKFLLHVVDVSNEQLIHRSTREIIQPQRYAQIGNELMVIGEKRVQRLKLEEETTH